jgi:26S proteasome regulatory subunit N7
VTRCTPTHFPTILSPVLSVIHSNLQDAEENLGETEVRDALHAKAAFLGSIGDREAAAAAYKDTEDKTASGASKADMVFAQIR